jgi:hypothetical protein
METGLPDATFDYLRRQIQGLSQRERLVSILIDKVYAAKRIEYQNGKFYGFKNSQVTKTLLCFMVKSVAGKYKDIVAMVPLSSISSEIINKWYQRVLHAVTQNGFDTVCTVSDAHSANKKFFAKKLCSGQLMTSIVNPYTDGSRIFLLFDSVHIFKNVYNNLLNRRKFKCPSFEGLPISANFKHIEDLYKYKLGRGVKLLSDKVLAPMPIERTKRLLADACFHDSTVNGLEQCCQDEKWKETANFIKLIWRFWNCVNVQSKFLAIHKRDERRSDIAMEDQQHNCSFLRSSLPGFVNGKKCQRRVDSAERLSLQPARPLLP